MKMIRYRHVLAAILIFISALIVHAQAPSPLHKRLLFQNSLLQEEENEFATVQNVNGQFTDRGWQSTTSGDDGSRLLIKFKDRLPQTATVSWAMKNFDPVNQLSSSKQHLFYMTGSEDTDEQFYNEGSWVYLRTGKNYINKDGSISMKIDVGAKGVENRVQRYIFDAKKWDKNKTYRFKLVYDNSFMWVYLDDQLLIQVDFPGQIKRFDRITFSDAPDYPSLAGPIYSDISIHTGKNEMYFIDKTNSKNAVGLGAPHYAGHGIAVGDVNGDGLEDIYLGNCYQEQCLRDVLYIQQPDGTFKDETLERGVTDECCSHGVNFFDADNDGDLDLFNANTWEPNQLYINDGYGYFTEESFARGIENIEGETRGSVVFDVNNDGFMDIFAVNWGSENEMYINDGTGHFKREFRGAEGAIEDPEKIGTQGVTVADIDADGDFEIYISKRDAKNELYLNDNGYFHNVAAERGAAVPDRSDGATFADFDNDGDMDLFVSNTRIPNTVDKIYLYVLINDGRGFFQDQTESHMLTMEGFTPLFLDADNDSHLDLYRLRNNDYYRTSVALLGLGDGQGNFESAGYCGATIIGADARSCVAHDFDADGDLDLYITNKRFENTFLENQSDISNHNWIEISTIGPQGDLGGLGSKIDIYKPGMLASPSARLSHREVVSAQGYLSGPSFIQHFGLGDFTSCDVRITLTDGTVIERQNIAANQRITITAEQYSLEYISGNNQTGVVNQLLSQPFRVRLLDGQGEPVANRAVSFSVAQGDGSFDGNPAILTDATGYASIYFRLGASEGTHIVEARVAGAKNSPVQFIANAQIAALTLQKVSGDNQNGTVGTILSQQLVVQTGYETGEAATDVAVTFSVLSGGGSIDGIASRTVQSDAEGRAAVRWMLGPISGQQVLNVSIPGQTVDFYATASADIPVAMSKVSGDGQSVAPGVAFPQPFSVRVADQYDNPVPGHDVIFDVTSGSGTINGSNRLTVTTGQQGMASVTWIPDRYLGPNNSLQAQSSYEGVALNNSPIVWSYTGVPVDASQSTVTASSPVPADGSSVSRIIVNLRNSSGESVGPGLTVDVSASGQKNDIRMENETTDSNGRIVALLSSIVGESKVITAIVKGLDLELENHPTVVFDPIDRTPDKILVTSGDNQTVPVSSNSEPLVVMIVDVDSLPVPNHEITFVLTEGEGSFDGQGAQIVRTGADGTARVVFQAGSRAGVVSKVEAQAADVSNSPAIFTLTSAPGDARKLLITSGNNQQGAPNTLLPQPLVVTVKDIYDNVVANYPVQFKVNMGECTLNDSSDVVTRTNVYGEASVQVKLGGREGANIVEAKTAFASVSFTLMTTEGLPDPDLKLSMISASSPVLADGVSCSDVVVTILDKYARPIEGMKVRITALGEGAKLKQPDSLTNDQGELNAKLAATVPGDKTLLASVLPQNTYIEQKATVLFERGNPTVEIISGHEQEGTVGQKCPQPLVVRLKNGENPYVGQYVRFTVESGGGHFNGQDTLMVTTDSLGLASAEYYVGTTAGLNIVRAAAPIAPDAGLMFRIMGHANEATKLLKQSGDEQTGQAGAELPEKLTVFAMDVYNNPVPNSSVTFSAMDGGAIAAPQSVLTDSSGSAGITAILGSNVGRYTFKALLPTGAFVLFSATAENANRAPNIISSIPVEKELDLSYGERLLFEITQALDPDNDPIYYSWFLNNQIVGNQANLLLYMSQVFPTKNTLTCAVSDGQDSSFVHWTLNLRTAVELSFFHVAYEKGHGVRLSWSTAHEQNNAGFHILRSSENGEYKVITDDLIKPASSKEYQFMDTAKLSAGTFFYKLKSLSKSGQTTEYGPVSVNVKAPEKMALLQNYPNPFNPTTTLVFELPVDSDVRLVIYNQKGQEIKELVNGDMSAGYHEVIWDARDGQGMQVPSGIYLYRMTSGDFSATKKLTLLK